MNTPKPLNIVTHMFSWYISKVGTFPIFEFKTKFGHNFNTNYETENAEVND